MDRRRMTRRSFLRTAGIGTAGMVLAACGATAAPAPAATTEPQAATQAPAAAATATPAPTNTPVPTAPPRIYGEGKTEIVVWYQDWDGANKILSAITPMFAEANPEVTLNLQAISYGDLFAKLLPAIATGTEGDVLMAYTNWVVATDVKQVFLDITEPAGGAAVLAEKMWPAAFNALNVPEGKVFYVPWLAGIRGACTTVNTDHLAAASIDYMGFESFEDVIEAGIALTETNADGKVTKSGFSIQSMQYVLLPSLMWQLGGSPYDKDTGKWSHNSPEGEEAAQIIHDVYWKHKTVDFELFQSEWEAIGQGLVSIWGEGAFSASGHINTDGTPCDNIVTPKLANAAENIQNPDHMAIWGLSKRLANSREKLQPAVDFAMALVSPDALVQAFEFYSGVCMSKEVYQDPRIEDTPFGVMSKRVAEGMWPIARYKQDHVAEHGPAGTELSRAMRQEISIKEALTNIDTYLQEQEDAARERIGI